MVIAALAVGCSGCAGAALVRSGDGLTLTDSDSGLMWLTNADLFLAGEIQGRASARGGLGRRARLPG